jgi:RHS repeat-associated protein
VWALGYDPFGNVSSVTDPMNHVVAYGKDALGRPLDTVLADGRSIAATYDGDSNETLLTLPSGQSHAFAYSPVDLVSTYTPPSVSSASTATAYQYDLDGRIKAMTRPDAATVSYAYDSAGRLSTTTYPQGTITRTYDKATGQLATVTAGAGEATAYSYNGFLTTSTAWTGPVAGQLLLEHADPNFRLTSQTVLAGSANPVAVSLGYDADGLLVQSGSMTINRDAQNGRLTGTTCGSIADSYTYDANGMLATYGARFGSTSLYSEAVQRDALGRITQKTEAIGSTTHVWTYAYDASGRLTDVTEDGSGVSHYGYDGDDNRTTFTNANGTVNPTYDAQDRLLTYGSATYAYSANGELTNKTVASAVTNYTYDVFGNLLNVALPGGEALAYVVDGQNRRVGRQVNGALTAGFLYQDALNVVAQLDGNGNLTARFVFATKPNVPDYFTTSAGTFRILSDHLGSPRLMVNTSTGAIVEEIDYDEFGNVTNDTNPGLTPFGFAGGLYDKDAGLVRFGARDYDPSVGRWTAKDSVRFDGGQINLYVYVGSDPVNGVDSTGRGFLAGALAGAGVAGLCEAYAAYTYFEAYNHLASDYGPQMAELRRQLAEVDCEAEPGRKGELEAQMLDLAKKEALRNAGLTAAETAFGLATAACVALGGSTFVGVALATSVSPW